MDDMEDAIGGGATAQGDLADVVARASSAMAALPSTSHHHQPPPPPPSLAAADHMSCAAAMAGQIVMSNPYYEEDRRLPVMFEAPSTIDPYLSSSMTTPRGGYSWLPPRQPLEAGQISQHSCYGRDMVMTGGGTTADVEGDDATRSSPVTPAAAAAHQMMNRKNDVKKVVCIPAPPATSSRPGGGGEVIPSDLWAWRKGYYRCSSSKGCMARKQVERSRSDPNMLVITYTAEHNHPWPMQRNVLAGYSRPQTHMTTNCKKKNSCRIVDPASLMSPSSSSKNDLEYQHSTNMMESNATAYGACTLGALRSERIATPMPTGCNGIQSADEVFAELEELESSNNNNPVNANIYSRGVVYDWNKL
ncbi:hypothetical protein PR202_ga14208 [Eleusine coracana subsp. coracana]|uniref:WRKY domain-containing protein n=1 Tax=Eleusine coracana subsp. coracana TaxID=191504 RepID=A0AAV5CGK2_ELECO|nr:hypothetical protein PR202_ga14208 [Eleusine coracana subsp. coracana]